MNKQEALSIIKGESLCLHELTSSEVRGVTKGVYCKDCGGWWGDYETFNSSVTRAIEWGEAIDVLESPCTMQEMMDDRDVDSIPQMVYERSQDATQSKSIPYILKQVSRLSDYSMLDLMYDLNRYYFESIDESNEFCTKYNIKIGEIK